MKKIKLINGKKTTSREIEYYFFKKGYEYALLHLHIGLKEEKLQGLEKQITKHLDFLKSCSNERDKK